MKRHTCSMTLMMLLICHGLLLVNTAIADEHNDNMTSVIQVHLARAKHSLGQTVLEIEKTGSAVLKAELDDIDSLLSSKRDTVVYQLLTLQNNKAVKQFINPETGAIQDSKTLRGFSFFNDDYNKATLEEIVIPMSKAIETAEKASGGKSFRAKLNEHEGIYIYMVTTINENGISTYLVDPLTGKTFKQLKNHDLDDDGDQW